MSIKKDHWADITAEKIVRNKGEKDVYVCASGITPSGTVHIGNFREIISVELIVRALKDMGKNTRFIYSWDDYDVFRKVPANMPNKEELEKYLRKPITSTPDPFGVDESFARHNEKEIESVLPAVGIFPEFIYQTKQYQSSIYADGMKRALEHRQDIIDILNEFRTDDLVEDWWPISVFCGKCQLDTTKINSWDGDYTISYTCDSCGHKEPLDLRKAKNAKLFWRVDWPMRWSYEKVDFEPGGKDHLSAGGSYDTAKVIASKVYNFQAPETFKYDFVSIKGQGGKISSSRGNVVSLHEMLEIYQPPIIRFLFAATRPNTEFAISFDLDVIKIYEDYDRLERVYFGVDVVSQEKRDKQARNYELSQVGAIPGKIPFQMQFRHLCNLLQINSGDIDRVIKTLNLTDAADIAYIRQRSVCAWNWITMYAPDDFKFILRDSAAPVVELSETERKTVILFREKIKGGLSQYDEKTLSELTYSVAQENGMEPKDFFKVFYRILIDKEMGPRLAGFILAIGFDRVYDLLKGY